jgi:hypothetical protein
LENSSNRYWGLSPCPQYGSTWNWPGPPETNSPQCAPCGLRVPDDRDARTQHRGQLLRCAATGKSRPPSHQPHAAPLASVLSLREHIIEADIFPIAILVPASALLHAAVHHSPPTGHAAVPPAAAHALEICSRVETSPSCCSEWPSPLVPSPSLETRRRPTPSCRVPHRR